MKWTFFFFSLSLMLSLLQSNTTEAPAVLLSSWGGPWEEAGVWRERYLSVK